MGGVLGGESVVRSEYGCECEVRNVKRCGERCEMRDELLRECGEE